MPPAKLYVDGYSDFSGCFADGQVFLHGFGVADHFRFVVYPVQGGVDRFFEAPPACFATVTLYAEALSVFAE